MSDRVLLGTLILGVVIAFSNLYKFGSEGEATNVVWTGVSLFALSFSLALVMISMRGKK